MARAAAEGFLGDVLPAPDEITRRSSGSHAALYIRRLIFDGVLRQGDRVPQDAIAEVLGLSRVPVREALLRLEREGWVVIKPHRGAFISTLDESVVRDHYELYGHVYGFAAVRAAKRHSDTELSNLADLQKRVAAAKDPEGAWRLNQAFHNAIVDMSRSPRLHAVLNAMAGIVPGNFFELVPGSVEVEKQGTAAILRAIKRGDGERASAEYGKMMRRQGDLVVTLFKARGILPAK